MNKNEVPKTWQQMTKQPSPKAYLKWSLKWTVQGWEASTEGPGKSSQMALVRGYCLLEGLPRLVAPFGRLWKRCSFPLASLMTDFLEAVLREMASYVPAALLCQSSSSHTSQLPAGKHAGFDCHFWKNAADGGTTGSVGHQQFHLQSQMAPLFTHPHPFSNAQGPSSSVTKATQWQDMCGFWRVGSLTGLRLKKGRNEQLKSYPRCLHAHLRRGREGSQGQHHTPSLLFSFSLFSSSLLLVTL